MSITRSDLLALLLAIGAGIAGVVVWANGTVSLGMTLEFDGRFVRVADVTPDGNAHRNYWYPGTTVIDIETDDGSSVERGDTLLEIMGDAERELKTVDGIGTATINLVWSPPWTPERIEPRVRAYLGF